ncbi:N-(5'-phosphoribosyl)anthranilate isomerase [Pseudooceanicola lipolyticus]|uniref:N-(5'-phosphoribosyl)anthranilate isomerase n=1 Tax=Pseudooceanicola lipolyticus TaxID=2029104 RepID=A0A2M8J5R2_9RHOB|nr:N-(5'-phosphoribosyl)anthranilate isomerase [Pseudooceanicola lipolyticus]PJE38119.1 N-(5'-phosphoribosyl)anthranilate isomerase [Pseudooceanicola lipolyticus]
MSETRHFLPPSIWMQRLFDAKAARQGGVVRRKLRDVELIVGKAAFEAELRRRGYHAVQNGDQIVVFCNNEPVRVLC